MPYGFAAAAGVSALGSVASGIIGSDASKSAANAQIAQQQKALDLQQSIFNQTKGQIAPYQEYGTNALQKLQDLLGIGPGGPGAVAANPVLNMLGIGGPGPMGSIDPSKFEGSPGYQYSKQQGMDAVTNAATRGPGGGNALLALQKTGQGLADQNWNNYLSNSSSAWQQLLQNIGGGVSTGLNATSLMAGQGQSFANAAGNDLNSMGNSRSAGIMGSANAIGGGITGGLQNMNDILTNPSVMAALTSMFNSGSTGVGNLPSTSNPFGATASDASNPQTYG